MNYYIYDKELCRHIQASVGIIEYNGVNEYVKKASATIRLFRFRTSYQGSSSTGTTRSFGLDCSGFVDWAFFNASNGAYVLGQGYGTYGQHANCRNISWAEVLPGDIVFYPGDSHVGIVCGFDEHGNVLIIHCSSGYNNVVVTGRSGFVTPARPGYYVD